MRKIRGRIVGVRSFVSKTNKNCRVFHVLSSQISPDMVGQRTYEVLEMEDLEVLNSSPESLLDTEVDLVSMGGRTSILEYLGKKKV